MVLKAVKTILLTGTQMKNDPKKRDRKFRYQPIKTGTRILDTDHARKTGVRGFTLIEVLLVAVIIAIIITVATPMFRSTLTTVELANVTQDIAQTMRLLKMEASTHKTIYQLKIDLAKRVYSAQQFGTKSGNYIVEPKKIPNNVDIAMTANPVTFYSDGSVDKVTIYLYRGKGEYQKDMEKVINKDFDLGQIQTISQTEYIYVVETQPSIGRIKVTVPEQE